MNHVVSSLGGDVRASLIRHSRAMDNREIMPPHGSATRGPEVSFWSITLLARSFCGTCPRSRFRANFVLADDNGFIA